MRSSYFLSPESTCILWNPKIPYLFHSSPLPVSVLSQSIKSTPQPVYWGSILVLSSHLRRAFPSCPFSFGFRLQNHTYAFPGPHACHTPYPSHSSWLNHPIILDMQYRPWSCPLYCLISALFALSSLGPTAFISTLLYSAHCEVVNQKRAYSHWENQISGRAIYDNTNNRIT